MGWGSGLVYSGESERERSVWAVPVRGCQTPVGYSSVYPYVGVQSSAGVFKTQQGKEGICAMLWPGVGCWNLNGVGGGDHLLWRKQRRWEICHKQGIDGISK